jgi:hypothetical protein
MTEIGSIDRSGPLRRIAVTENDLASQCAPRPAPFRSSSGLRSKPVLQGNAEGARHAVGFEVAATHCAEIETNSLIPIIRQVLDIDRQAVA